MIEQLCGGKFNQRHTIRARARLGYRQKHFEAESQGSAKRIIWDHKYRLGKKDGSWRKETTEQPTSTRTEAESGCGSKTKTFDWMQVVCTCMYGCMDVCMYGGFDDVRLGKAQLYLVCCFFCSSRATQRDAT